MPFALGPDDAKWRRLGGCVERDRVFVDVHALHGDQQENNCRRGNQLTDAKARTMLLRFSDLSEVGHLNSPYWMLPGRLRSHGWVQGRSNGA